MEIFRKIRRGGKHESDNRVENDYYFQTTELKKMQNGSIIVKTVRPYQDPDSIHGVICPDGSRAKADVLNYFTIIDENLTEGQSITIITPLPEKY